MVSFIKFSIITRTGNRPQFLERALNSLVNSIQPDSEWIICDDAPQGTPNIESFVEKAEALLNTPVKLVKSRSGNRPRAANAGLQVARGELVHLHDDDDTVKAEFYLQTSDFLEKNPEYGGVATCCNRIDEKFDDGKFKTISNRPHYHEIQTPTILSMATTQTIAPIAFVARRAVMKEVGEYNENLEVCEDHEYFLRFLLKADIGHHSTVLAAFHHRPANTTGSARNSMVSAEHKTVDAKFRNEMLRQDISSGKIGIGWLLAAGEMNRGNWRTNIFLNHLRRYRFFSAALKFLRR